MNLNKSIVLGRLTSAIEVRVTTGGQSVASASIATNRSYTDKKGQKQEQTEFHNVVFWGRQAELAAQFLAKGSLVLVEGRLQTRTYEDRDGVSRRVTEIVVESVQFGPRPDQPAKLAPTTVAPTAKELAPEETIVMGGGGEEDTGKSMGALFPDEEKEIRTEDIPF